MKKHSLFTLFLFLNFISIAQETQVSILQSSPNSVTLQYRFGAYNLHQQTVNGISTVYPEMDETSLLLDKDAPDLCKVVASLQVPNAATVSYEIVSENYTDIPNTIIRPSKGNLYRNVDPATIAYKFGEIYDKDAWYPRSQVSIQSEYQVRDLSGRAIWVYPFRTQPLTNTLRIYKEIVVKINFESIVEKASINKIDRAFEGVYKNHFINYESSKYDPIVEEGKMLIISHADYISEMLPFSEWKTQIGIENEIVDVAEIGGASAIKQFVQNYFDTHGLTYLLLVGDHSQLPADLLSAGYSDNSYAYVVGDDHYPDLFVGRFSVENIMDVQTMVNRSIDYELNPASDNSYKNAVGIGSEDGTESTNPNSENTGMGDDGEADWHHQMNIKADLLAYNYTTVYELYEGGPYEESIDEAGYPNSIDLGSKINNGIGLINYTGHGSSQEFVTTGFNNNDVDALTNTEVFPFIFSVACVNGEFMNSTCFAEKWLRAKNEDNNPTGAIAVIMSTINQSWNPPMSGQDEMNDLLTEQYDDNRPKSFGAITMQGCMKMNDDYGSDGDEMTDTWMIFGDPSLVVRTDKVGDVIAEHSSVLPLGSESFTVNSANEGAIAALTFDNDLVAEGLVVDGMVTLNFDPIVEVAAYTLTLTSYNNTPYVTTIQSIVLEGPFVIQEGLSLSVLADGSDSQADYGDSLVYSLGLENVGTENTEDLTVIVTTESPFITLHTDTFEMDLIDADSVVWMNEAFSISVASNVPDQSTALLNFEIIDEGGATWYTNSQITLAAPVLFSTAYLVNDSLANNNGEIDLGESFILEFPVTNIGSSSSETIQASLSSSSPYLVIEDTTVTVNSLAVNNSGMVSFMCSLLDEIPTSTDIDFVLTLSSGAYSYTYNSFHTTSACEVDDLEIVFNFVSDYYSSDETSLLLVDADGNVFEEMAVGDMQDDFTYNLNYCASENTVMQFTLTDSYGDGISYGGSYSISVCDEELLAGGSEEFDELVSLFVVTCDQESVVFGCTDMEASNYNFEATFDDGSCISDVSIVEIGETAWRIYPNPNTGSQLMVQMDCKSNLSIRNMIGDLVYSSSVEPGLNKFTLPQLNAGLYLVQTLNGDVKKLIVY